MQIDLQRKVILVTGGSEGIGAAVAQAVADCGGTAAILARNEPEMQAVVDKIEASGGKALWVRGDVTDDDQVSTAIRELMARTGRLDGLVANAGINGTWAPIEELSPQQWRSTIDVNLTGTYMVIHHCVPHLKAQDRSSIVVMSSINGTRTFSSQGASAYAASKAGQLALAKMLALELAAFHVRINTICPGGIDSNIHEKTKRKKLSEIEIPVEFPEGSIPLTGGDMGDASQVAKLAVFLLSDLSSHITGTPIWIDGGQSLLQ